MDPKGACAATMALSSNSNRKTNSKSGSRNNSGRRVTWLRNSSRSEAEDLEAQSSTLESQRLTGFLLQGKRLRQPRPTS